MRVYDLILTPYGEKCTASTHCVCCPPTIPHVHVTGRLGVAPKLGLGWGEDMEGTGREVIGQSITTWARVTENWKHIDLATETIEIESFGDSYPTF